MLVRRSGVQSVFQFIPKVFSGVEVRALCRTLEFFHSNLNTPCLHEARFVHMLEQILWVWPRRVRSADGDDEAQNKCCLDPQCRAEHTPLSFRRAGRNEINTG
ncbi:hypothetical protein PGIGA_G00021130 [Pangasianodon gigas]|uniref:Uncharacterized protein n=1 Tax=Pangasianodon gigas TaxID=30993 RepID=A0ACC5WV87_PANGG|nr:hypothetical protein [Pangasianodon gigas]